MIYVLCLCALVLPNVKENLGGINVHLMKHLNGIMGITTLL